MEFEINQNYLKWKQKLKSTFKFFIVCQEMQQLNWVMRITQAMKTIKLMIKPTNEIKLLVAEWMKKIMLFTHALHPKLNGNVCV